METFKINKGDNGAADTVACQQLKLSITVLENKADVKETDVAYMTTHIDGSGNEYNLYFVVKDGASEFGHKNWSLELFMDMIDFYCANELKNEYEGIDSINWKANYVYDGKYEDSGFPRPADYVDGDNKPSDIYDLLSGI